MNNFSYKEISYSVLEFDKMNGFCSALLASQASQASKQARYFYHKNKPQF